MHERTGFPMSGSWEELLDTFDAIQRPCCRWRMLFEEVSFSGRPFVEITQGKGMRRGGYVRFPENLLKANFYAGIP